MATLTYLFSGVTALNSLTFVFLDGLAFGDILLENMLVIVGFTFGFVLSSAFYRSRDIAVLHHGGVAELDAFVMSHLVVLDKAILFEVLLAFLFLLGSKVRGLDNERKNEAKILVTSLLDLSRLPVMAVDGLLVFSFLHIDDFINASLTSNSHGFQVDWTRETLSKIDGLELNNTWSGKSLRFHRSQINGLGLDGWSGKSLRLHILFHMMVHMKRGL
ncbi:hypothetical protein TCAL_15378, partial [Tigriopus californicus]